MATPKVFVSSTCYDLNEIRLNLKNYIQEFGCDSVMSEFGDIFYDPTAHVQDACVDAIKQSDLFILIIGNSYGSLYYDESTSIDTPDSVTVREFKKALSLKIPKIVFINMFVNYDYHNYRKFLNEHFKEFFSKHTVNEEDKELEQLRIKRDFDGTYKFNQPSYKYIFYFLDQIKELQTNNAYFEFNNSNDIKLNLKKQFAGYFYNALKISQDKLVNKVEFERKTLDRLAQLEKLLISLADELKDNNQRQGVNLNKFINSAGITESSDLRKHFDDSIQGVLYQVVYDYDEDEYWRERVEFLEDLGSEAGFNKISKWATSLKNLVNTYKWTQNINSEIVFSEFDCKLDKMYSDIPLCFLEQLNVLYDMDEDKNSFAKSLQSKFMQLVKISRLPFSSDDVPF